MTSYYEATAVRPSPTPQLDGSVTADVCVIGAGYTGLMAALTLAERGTRVVVLEANRIGDGASGRNGGQLGSGQRRRQGWLEERYGAARAHQLWEIAEDAKALAKRRIAQHSIACELKPGVLTVAHRGHLLPDLHAGAQYLRRHYGYDKIQTLSKADVEKILGTRIYHGGILDTDAAHLHPLVYVLGLARAAQEAGATLHENSRVTGLDIVTGEVTTARGRVKADSVLIACNGELDRLIAPIAGYIMPINNFIIATEPLGEKAHALIRKDVAVADTRFVIHYYRLSSDRRLLFGGGESYGRRLPADPTPIVRRHLLRVFPDLKNTRIDYAWGGTLAITLERMPHIGRIGPRGYFAQGFSGHGITLSGMAGALCAEAMLGPSPRFELMASLNLREFPGGTLLRNPLRVAAMLYGQLRDAL